MNLKLPFQDARRLWRELRVYRAERRVAARRDLGLAFFEAVDAVAAAGAPTRYRAAVTDLGSRPRRVRLVLDFWRPGMQDPAHGRAAHLAFNVDTRPRRRRHIDVVTDRIGLSRARCDDTIDLPCHLESGNQAAVGHHDVILSLMIGNETVDRIIVRQQLEPASP